MRAPIAFLALGAWCSVARARNSIAILESDDLPAYTEPADNFAKEVGRFTEVFNLHGDRRTAEQIAKQLRDDPPPLIFALGAKAAWMAVHDLPRVPTIYAMVLDPDRYGIEGAFVTGVSMELPPDMVLAQFQLFAPHAKRLGVLLSQGNSSKQVEAALAAARQAGLQPIVRRVTRSADVRRAFSHIRDHIDALWILPDTTVVTPANFHFLRNEALRMRLPMLTYSEMLVDAGALMCVSPDRAAVGRQAAGIARRVLAGTTAGAIEPEAPEVPRVVLNRDTQEAIGLRFDPALLDFVDEVVKQPTTR